MRKGLYRLAANSSDLFDAPEGGAAMSDAPLTDAVEQAIPESAELCEHWHAMDQHARGLERKLQTMREALQFELTCNRLLTKGSVQFDFEMFVVSQESRLSAALAARQGEKS
jgi:hypothetical protein